MLIDLERAGEPLAAAADVCIVGAGAAGLTVARRLLAGGRSVLLLESGGRDYSAAAAELNAGENVGERYYDLQDARLRFFGGTTAIWGGRCAELDEVDFTPRDHLPGSGWPFNKADLNPWYALAWRALDLSPDPPAVDKLAAFDGGDLQPRFWRFDDRGDRFTLSRCDDLTGHPRCTVVLNATATAFDLTEQRGAVRGVTARSLKGQVIHVTAEAVVLAAGGLETPRLMLAAGIAAEHDQVGRYFMEHPHGRGGRVVADRAGMLLRLLASQERVGAERVCPLLTLTAEVQAREGVMNSGLTLAARQPVDAREEIGSALYKRAKHRLPPRSSLRRAWRTGRAAARRAREVTDPLWPWLAVQRGRRELTLVLRAEQAPNPDSRITLGEARDALGVPRLKLDWRLSEIDRRSVRVLVDTVGREFSRMGLGKVEPAAWLSEPGGGWTFDGLASAHPIGGYHHMGTTRMSNDPRQGVVDAFGRVHGMRNVWVVGSSVFPTSGWANPTLTILALSMRTADRLLQEG